MKDFILCFINVTLLVCGQLMFKYGTQGEKISSFPDIIKLLLSPYMIIALVLYTGAALLWVYILTKIPISYAYPIQALAFPLVVTMSFFLFKEAVPLNRWVGVGIIITGAFIASI